MPAEPAIDVAQNQPRNRVKTAEQRLAELQRALQRTAALERCALLMLRAEIAARDPECDSNDVVRLDNCARRARADFERVTGIDTARKPKPPLSMADIEAQIATLSDGAIDD
jgi:hypothetical protein